MKNFHLFVTCFDIGEVPRSPGKLNWNRLSFLPFVFIFEQCGLFDLQLHNCNDARLRRLYVNCWYKSSAKYHEIVNNLKTSMNTESTPDTLCAIYWLYVKPNLIFSKLLITNLTKILYDNQILERALYYSLRTNTHKQKYSRLR